MRFVVYLFDIFPKAMPKRVLFRTVLSMLLFLFVGGGVGFAECVFPDKISNDNPTQVKQTPPKPSGTYLVPHLFLGYGSGETSSTPDQYAPCAVDTVSNLDPTQGVSGITNFSIKCDADYTPKDVSGCIENDVNKKLPLKLQLSPCEYATMALNAIAGFETIYKRERVNLNRCAVEQNCGKDKDGNPLPAKTNTLIKVTTSSADLDKIVKKEKSGEGSIWYFCPTDKCTEMLLPIRKAKGVSFVCSDFIDPIPAVNLKETKGLCLTQLPGKAPGDTEPFLNVTNLSKLADGSIPDSTAPVCHAIMTDTGQGLGGIFQFIFWIVNFFQILLVSAGIIGLVGAGIYMMFAPTEGDVKKARNMLVQILLGLVVLFGIKYLLAIVNPNSFQLVFLLLPTALKESLSSKE